VDFLILVALLESISGFIFYFTGIKTFLGYTFTNKSPGFHGTFVNKNHFSAFLEMALPFSLWGFFFKKEKIQKYIHLLIFLFLIFSIFLSLSRAGILVAFLEVILFLFFYSYLDGKRKFFRYFASILAIFFTIFVLNFSMLTSRILTTIFQFKNIEGNIKRLLIWKGAFNSFLHHPLFGVGPGNFSIIFTHFRPIGLNSAPRYAHNEFLQFGVENGIFFLIFFLLLLVYLFHILYRGYISAIREEKRGLFAATFSSFLGISLHSLVDFPLHIPVIALFLFLLFLFSLCNFRWNYFKGVVERVEIEIRGKLRLFLIIVFTITVLVSLSLFISSFAEIRGDRFYKIDNFSKSLNYYKFAEELSPLNSNLPFKISKIYEKESFYGLNRYRKYKKAIFYLLKAIRLNSQKGFYWIKLVEISENFFVLNDRYWKYLLKKDYGREIFEEFKKHLNKNFRNRWDLLNYLYSMAEKCDRNNFVLMDLWALHFLRQGNKIRSSKLIYRSFLTEPEISMHTIFTRKFLIENFRNEIKKALLYNLKRKRYFKDTSLFLIEIFKSEGDFKSAIEVAKKYLSIYPDDGDLNFTLGVLYLRMGMNDRATYFFMKYLKLNYFSHESVTLVLDKMLKFKGISFVVNFLNGNSEIFKNDPEIFLWLSKYFEGIGNYDLAISWIKKYIDNNGENGKVFFIMGKLYKSKGEYLEGAKNFLKAMEKGYRNENVYLELAESFYKNGNISLAKKYLEIGISIYPGSEKLKKFLNRLNGGDF